MKQAIRNIASTLKTEDERFAIDINESGKASQAAFEKMTHAAHRMHSCVMKMVADLEHASQAKD